MSTRRWQDGEERKSPTSKGHPKGKTPALSAVTILTGVVVPVVLSLITAFTAIWSKQKDIAAATNNLKVETSRVEQVTTGFADTIKTINSENLPHGQHFLWDTGLDPRRAADSNPPANLIGGPRFNSRPAIEIQAKRQKQPPYNPSLIAIELRWGGPTNSDPLSDHRFDVKSRPAAIIQPGSEETLAYGNDCTVTLKAGGLLEVDVPGIQVAPSSPCGQRFLFPS